MDLQDTLLISSLQKKIVQWLSFCKIINYSKLYDGCLQLIKQEEIFLGRELKRTWFYRVVFPLIKVGIIDYEVSERGEISFFLPTDDGDNLIKRKTNDFSRYDTSLIDINKARNVGKMILSQLPSIKDYVRNIQEESISIKDLSYKQDEVNFSLRNVKTASSIEVGLYKERDYVFFPYYLVDIDGIPHKLKTYRESLEDMDYAHSYVQLAKNKSIFGYNSNLESISFFNQPTVPLFVIRAMCLVDPEVLKTDDIYVGKNVSFHVSDDDVIKELKRIYGVK